MIKKVLIPYLIVLILFLLVDLPVILYFNKPMYEAQFNRINKNSSNISKTRIFSSAIFAYLLLALGIYVFIIKQEMDNYKQNYFNITIKGMILGLIIYGIYNGTNMATIKEWGLKEFAIDTLWGTMLTGFLSVTSVYLIKLFNLSD